MKELRIFATEALLPSAPVHQISEYLQGFRSFDAKKIFDLMNDVVRKLRFNSNFKATFVDAQRRK